MPRGQPRGQQQPVETPAAVIASPDALPESTDPLQKHRRVEDMGEAELRAYAVQIGLYPGDAQRLEVERLRQNCLIRLYDLIEEI